MQSSSVLAASCATRIHNYNSACDTCVQYRAATVVSLPPGTAVRCSCPNHPSRPTTKHQAPSIPPPDSSRGSYIPGTHTACRVVSRGLFVLTLPKCRSGEGSFTSLSLDSHFLPRHTRCCCPTTETHAMAIDYLVHTRYKVPDMIPPCRLLNLRALRSTYHLM